MRPYFFLFWQQKTGGQGWELTTKVIADREPHLVGPGDVPLVGVHAAAETAPGVDPSSAEQGGRPALGLFGQRVDAGDAAAGVPEQHTPWDTSIIENEIRRYDLSDWAHFSLCREGWITPNEAEFLVQWCVLYKSLIEIGLTYSPQLPSVDGAAVPSHRRDLPGPRPPQSPDQ